MNRWNGWASVVVSVAVVAPAGADAAAASRFAVLQPGIGWGTADPGVAAAVERATAAIGRPPGAVAELHTEGTLPGHGIREQSLVAQRDHPIALDLAIAWRATGDRRYLDQAVRYLTAWATTYHISFNPIDETGFDALVMATDLVAGAAPRADLATIDGFWTRMAAGYLDAMDAGTRNPNTNWQSHRIKLATLAAYRSGDAKLIARAGAAFRKQIAANLNADGSTFDFGERDALHYVTYDLDPLLTAALAARAHGADWYGYVSPNGSSLRRSLDWLATFASGERTHIEFVNSKVAFDRERAAAGQDEYAPHPWRPAAATDTFALAAALDPRFAPLRDALIRSGGRRLPPWIAASSRRP